MRTLIPLLHYINRFLKSNLNNRSKVIKIFPKIDSSELIITRRRLYHEWPIIGPCMFV